MLAGGKAEVEEGAAALNIHHGVLKYLQERRSVAANCLIDPGPDSATLAAILAIAARVPDHKKLAPWRFLAFEGKARAAFGEILADCVKRDNPDAPHDRLALERGRFCRAPAVVAVIFSPVPHPAAPEWEQILSAGAVCLNMLHGASAFGFGANWITEWCAYDAQVLAAMGLAPHEKVAGFIHIGTPKMKPSERERPDVNAKTVYWRGPTHKV